MLNIYINTVSLFFPLTGDNDLIESGVQLQCRSDSGSGTRPTSIRRNLGLLSLSVAGMTYHLLCCCRHLPTMKHQVFPKARGKAAPYWLFFPNRFQTVQRKYTHIPPAPTLCSCTWPSCCRLTFYRPKGVGLRRYVRPGPFWMPRAIMTCRWGLTFKLN